MKEEARRFKICFLPYIALILHKRTPHLEKADEN